MQNFGHKLAKIGMTWSEQGQLTSEVMTLVIEKPKDIEKNSSFIYSLEKPWEKPRN